MPQPGVHPKFYSRKPLSHLVKLREMEGEQTVPVLDTRRSIVTKQQVDERDVSPPSGTVQCCITPVISQRYVALRLQQQQRAPAVTVRAREVEWGVPLRVSAVHVTFWG